SGHGPSALRIGAWGRARLACARRGAHEARGPVGSAMTEAVLKLSEPQTAQLYAGKYRVEGKLGEGGMGVVYRARELNSGREVALKQLLYSTAGHKRKSAEALFEREYHTLVRLKHPRIIEVYDYGLSEQGPFYTMELPQGQDLVKA